MRKFCLAFFLALFVCVGSCFAFSSGDCPDLSTYSVSSDSVVYRLVDTASSVYATTGWTDTDRNYLNQIRLALTSSNPGTLLNYVFAIYDSVSNSYDKLFDIKRNTDYLQNINNNSNSILSSLTNDINGPVIRDLLTNIKNNTLAITSAWTSELASSVNSAATQYDYLWNNQVVPHWRNGSPNPTWFTSILFNMGYLTTTLLYDDVTFWNDGAPTFYGLVHRLQKTLASDEDIALAEAQKSNRIQIEQDFVSGSSGKTSLGASDFSDLSSVGGSVKDSISLNGQSSISSFTGGLSDSDAVGQGWFSASTRDSLDTVSPSSSSFRASRSSDDTYNMAGFTEHYSWLYGG